MKLIIVAILIVGNFIPSAAAQTKGSAFNEIITAVPFLSISPDANSIYWNPSKLAFLDRQEEFSISYSPWLRSVIPNVSCP